MNYSIDWDGPGERDREDTMEHIQITAQAVAEAVAIERKKCAAENERLRAALRRFAGQMKSDELGEDDGDDFEGAYDAMIEEAREVLSLGQAG